MADAMDHEPVTYGSPKPPTVEERQASRIAELHRAEQDLWLTQNAVNDAHAELDRLDVPRETHDGYLLSLATRIRYATCGTHRHDAQPRLLQEWAPEVWSGRRCFVEESA